MCGLANIQAYSHMRVDEEKKGYMVCPEDIFLSVVETSKQGVVYR